MKNKDTLITSFIIQKNKVKVSTYCRNCNSCGYYVCALNKFFDDLKKQKIYYKTPCNNCNNDSIVLLYDDNTFTPILEEIKKLLNDNRLINILDEDDYYKKYNSNGFYFNVTKNNITKEIIIDLYY